MSDLLHLVSQNEAPPEQNISAVQNLLQHFNLLGSYDANAQSTSKTFKSYIRHLPGDFHISKQGRVAPAGSLKKVLENAPPPEDAQPIHFQPISDRQLQAAFSLQEGGYISKKKKKKRAKMSKEGGAGTPSTGSFSSEEQKRKKKKRHREGTEGTTEDGHKRKKKKKDKDKKKDSSEKRTPSATPPTPLTPTRSSILSPHPPSLRNGR
eukprot:TRINITY_DN15722_c0_g1_i1.p1 TRINITY_DN15722_c0_g1~~TRINITY_DN15722_c0_g1_i1.p1  ORF type:complete len:208 (-),score=82.76 TRINITY_DN15722_c0_g1_i1:226-849(-)